MPERLKGLHQLADELKIGINELEAAFIDKKEIDVIVLRIGKLEEIVSKFQAELNQIREKLHGKEKRL